jgi:hypothetical protein
MFFYGILPLYFIPLVPHADIKIGAILDLVIFMWQDKQGNRDIYSLKLAMSNINQMKRVNHEKQF